MKHFLMVLLTLLSQMPIGSAMAQVKAPANDEFRVTLLGTGSPAPVMRRFGPGVLVQAGGKPAH